MKKADKRKRIKESEENFVSDDTLEFLSLDDETIEAYEQSYAARPKKKASLPKKSKKSKKQEIYEEELEEEDYEAEDADEDYIFEELEEIDDEETDEDDGSYAYYGEEGDGGYAYYAEEEEAGAEGEEYYRDDEIAEEEEADGRYIYYAEDEEADDENDEYYRDGEEDDEADGSYAYYAEDEEADDENYEYYGEEEEIDDEDYEYYENYEEIDDEEDEDYEDDEEDDYQGNIFVRFGHFITHMSAIDYMVAFFGCFIVIAGVAMGVIYAGARSVSKQVEAFAEIGTEMEGIHVIGESGLLAVSNAESARLSQMFTEEPEEIPTEEINESESIIDIGLNLTSIQSDIKIKFINKSTGKLISGVPFEVEVTGNKNFNLKDDDKDGIIYQTGVDAGSYTVKMVALQGEEYLKYRFPSQGETVKVTDTIAYKKVDVADEIKTEAEVNVAAEDTAVQDTVVESALTDTVEWVESTKTEIDADGNFQEIKMEDIPDPATIGRADSGTFVKLANTGGISRTTENPEDNDNPGEGGGSGNNPGGDTGNNGGTGDNGEGNDDNPGGSGGDNSGNSGGGSGNNGGNTGDNGEGNDNNPGGSGGDNSGNSGSSGENNPPTQQPSDEDKLNAMNPQLTSAVTLTKGTSQTLSVSLASGKGQPDKIEWKSSDAATVSVSNGVVKGEKAGKAEITATVTVGAKSKTLKCSVTVTEAEVKYKSLTISGSGTIQVGKTGAVKGKTDPEGGTVTWKSDNENVVKVDSNGTLTGVSVGNATITGTCGDAKNTWKVTVYKDVSGDTKTKLKDKNGNQIFVKNAEGKYVEATYADYYKNQKFYLRKAKASYLFTGWQTIDNATYFFDKNGNFVTGEQVIQGAKYSFGSDGRLSSGSGSLGIDVSKWNGSIDWNAVKNSGVSYVIIRCGYRGSSTGALIEDPKFRSNIQGAKAAGLKVGVYFFSQAVNEVEAVEEASMALSLVNGYGLNYPIFLDVESSGGRGDAVDVGTRTAVCKAFCNTIQNSGYSAGIYANKTWFTSYINTGSLTGYKIWLAQYASTPTYTATRYDMWQYSSKGSVGGISGNVDMNISYMNY